VLTADVLGQGERLGQGEVLGAGVGVAVGEVPGTGVPLVPGDGAPEPGRLCFLTTGDGVGAGEKVEK
jgi:hypothetical protein